MFVFMYITCLSFGSIVRYLYNDTKAKKIITIVCCIVCVCMASFRGISVGTDTASYYRIFNAIQNGYTSHQLGIEAGFFYYIKLLNVFTDSFAFYLFLTAILTYVPLFIFIYYNSRNYLLSIMLFLSLFFYDSLNISRQYMAIAIAINCLTLDKYEKRKWAYFLCFFASTFHISALVYAGVLFIYHNYNRRIVRQITFILLVIILAFMSNPQNIIEIIRYSIYSYYLQTKFIMGSNSIGFMSIVYCIVALCGWLLTIFKYRCLEYKGKSNEYFFILILMTIGASLVLASNQIIILTRVALLFNIFIIWLFPVIIDTYFSDNSKKILNGASYIALGVAVNMMTKDAQYILGV